MIGHSQVLIVIVLNRHLGAARWKTRCDFQKRSNVPPGLDMEFDYEITTT